MFNTVFESGGKVVARWWHRGSKLVAWTDNHALDFALRMAMHPRKLDLALRAAC